MIRTPHTVTIAGPERHDGEAPYTYCVLAVDLAEARAAVRAWHIRNEELDYDWLTGETRYTPDVEIVEGARDTFAGAPFWAADADGCAWQDLREDFGGPGPRLKVTGLTPRYVYAVREAAHDVDLDLITFRKTVLELAVADPVQWIETLLERVDPEWRGYDDYELNRLRCLHSDTIKVGKLLRVHRRVCEALDAQSGAATCPST